MKPLEYEVVMWAELWPDVYDGPNCDQASPQWKAGAEGDKGDDDLSSDPLVLEPRTFPPGTKVVVSVPICPECDLTIDYFGFNPPMTDEDEWKVGKCDCGFDWKDWMDGEYS